MNYIYVLFEDVEKGNKYVQMVYLTTTAYTQVKQMINKLPEDIGGFILYKYIIISPSGLFYAGGFGEIRIRSHTIVYSNCMRAERMIVYREYVAATAAFKLLKGEYKVG